MAILGKIFRYVLANWTYFALVAVLGTLAYFLYNYQARGEKIKLLTRQVKTLTAQRSELAQDTTKLGKSLRTTAATLNSSKRNYERLENNRKKAIAEARQWVKNATPEQKRDRLIELAKKAKGDAYAWTPLPITYDSTGGVKVDTLTSFTSDQIDGMTWTILEGQYDTEAADTTRAERARIDAVKEQVNTEVVKPLQAEAGRRRFLGIGRRKAMRRLVEQIQTFLNTPIFLDVSPNE